MDYETLFSDKMDELIIEEMARTNTPGTALAVVHDSELVFTRCYGAQDFELGKSVNADTLFNVASVTKSFICAGILKLQEEGKLSVMDKISDIIPVTVGFEDDPILIHHLMNHTSGIPNLADWMWARNVEHLMGSSAVPKYPFTSWDDGFRHLNGAQEFLSKPGKRFHYNNFGYGLLSKIITEVAGTSYKNYLKKVILKPLGMKRSGFFTDIAGDENLAKGYMDKVGSETKEFVHVPYEQNKLSRSLDEAAGGLFSSVKELSRYLIMQASGGSFGDKQIMSSESVAEMQKRQFEEVYPNSAFQASYGQNVSGYGYGFAIDEDFYGHKLVQHSGSFIGASAWFSFLPDLKRGVVMLSNHHPSPRILSQAILIESLGKDLLEWPLFKLRKHHEKLVGEYESYKGMNKITIQSKGGALYIVGNRMNQMLVPLNDPYSYDYYVPNEMAGKDPVQFEEIDGKIFLNIERDRWLKR